MNSYSSSDLKKGILIRLNKEKRFEESLEISKKLGSIPYYNNDVDIAIELIKNKDLDKAMDFIHSSDAIGYGEISSLYLKMHQSVNDKSNNLLIYCSIQFYFYSLISAEYGLDGEYEESMQVLINNIYSVELLSDLIDLIPLRYGESIDFSYLAHTHITAKRIEKAKQVISLISDESLRFSVSCNIIKQKIDNNNFNGITYVIDGFSNPILKLNLFLESYIYLKSQEHEKQAIIFLKKAISFSKNLSYQEYCYMLLYSKVLSVGSEKHQKVLISELNKNSLHKIKNNFLNYKFLSDFHIQGNYKQKISQIPPIFKEANVTINPNKNVAKEIDKYEEELYVDGEIYCGAEVIINGIDLLIDLYDFDIEKAKNIEKIIIEKISTYTHEDFISVLINKFVNENIEKNWVNSSNIDCILRIANKITDDNYGGVKSKTFFSIFKYFISLEDYKSSTGTLDNIIINEIEYNDFLNQLKLIINDNHEQIAVDLVCKAKYNDSSTKDLFLNDIILYIYSKSNKISEYIFNLFDNIDQRIVTQGNIIGELFLNNDLQENKSIFTSHISKQYIKYEENDSLMMALTGVILKKNINFNFKYFLSIIKNSGLSDKIRFKIIDCYIKKGETLEKIVNIIEINQTNRDEEYEKVSKLLSSSKRFDDAVELASRIKYNDNHYENTLRSDTISAILIDIMKSGHIQKAINYCQIIDKIDTKIICYSSLSKELINLFTLENHKQLYGYLNVILKKKESLYKHSAVLSSTDKSIDEIYDIELANAYIKMLENFNSKTSAISKELLGKVINLVKIIEKDDFRTSLGNAFHLVTIGKLLKNKKYIKESQITIKKALNINLIDNKLNIEEWCDSRLDAVFSDSEIENLTTIDKYIQKVSLFYFEIYKYYYEHDEFNKNKYFDLSLDILNKKSKSFCKRMKKEPQNLYLANYHIDNNFVYKKILIDLASKNETDKFLKVLPNFIISKVRIGDIYKKLNIKDEINKYINSAELILNKSKGEVLNIELTDYNTNEPFKGGLFCKNIFALKSYGNNDKYNVGHINLCVPVLNPMLSIDKLVDLTCLSRKDLEMIIYYHKYMIIQRGIGGSYNNGEPIKNLDVITEEDYLNIIELNPIENQNLNDKDPNKFIAKMGAEAIQDLLNKLDLEHKFTVSVVPVVHPEFRPLNNEENSSPDLNDFYRKIIVRNNRLKRLMEINAPDIILRNEKRRLQEAFDVLPSVLNNQMKEKETSIVRRLLYLIEFLKELSIVLETKAVKEVVNLYLEDLKLLVDPDRYSYAHSLLAEFYLDLSKDCDTVEASESAINKAKELSKNITTEKYFTKFCTSLAKAKGIKEAIVFMNYNREKVNLNNFSKNLTIDLVDSGIDKHEEYIFLSNLNNYPNIFNSILQKKAHMSLFIEKEVSIEKLNVLEQVIDIKNIKEIADSI